MLQPINDADLALILKWRNHPEVKNVMFTDQEITMDEHIAWWEKVKTDLSKKVYLFIYNGQPVGIVNFFDIETEKRISHWGFYLDNFREWAKDEKLKAWLRLEEEAIECAFGLLGCETLVCETFSFNQHVLALHRKFKFKEIESIERIKNGKPEKVIVLALKKEAVVLTEQSKAAQQLVKAMQVVFLGSANWDILAEDFGRRYQAITGQAVDIVPMPYGQYRTMLADADSHLYKAAPEYYFFCERIEDLLDRPFSIFDFACRKSVERKFGDYIELIRRARERISGKFLVLDFAAVRPISASLDSAGYEVDSEAGFLNQLNARLSAFCKSIPDCYVVRLSSVVEQFGAQNANPGKYWHLGRIAYQVHFGQELNKRLIQTIVTLSGKTARVLVLDLDNTLWGGVIGDDGLSGIKLGGDYPGSVFVEIQETLKTFRDRGIALTICSKNTEAVALEALNTHPGMRLSLDDFVLTKINWKDKAGNIKEIAEEIGVGLSSICFIDDSPYERESVRRMLPNVIVPDLPEDLTQWSEFLLNYPFLANLSLTQEDQERADRYRVRARIQKEAEGFGDKEQYWRSLEMHLFFHKYYEGNQQRVIQLLSKTNQFNMTTQRYSEMDLIRVQQNGGLIVPIGLSDKYSERETIGVLILRPSGEKEHALTIDTFLLSCRVLGRSVESAILGWVYQYAKSCGYRYLEGIFHKTEKNEPASDVYHNHGFTKVGIDRWLLDTELAVVVLPDWFGITEDYNQ